MVWWAAVGVMAWCVGVVAGDGCLIDDGVLAPENESQKQMLERLSPLVGLTMETYSKTYLYNFKFCGNVWPKRPNVTLVQKKDGGDVVSLGLYNRTLVRSEEYWMMLTFLQGDNFTNECNNKTRESHVLIVCDRKVTKPSMSVLDDSDKTLKCSPSFIIRHHAVCTKHGLGGWSIFFIIVLVTFGGYFVFGFLYLRVVKGAKGVEQIPHRNFWFKVGNMLADGCGAVFRCDRYCGGGETGVGGAPTTSSSYSGYSPIEDRLVQDLQEADRDSALLSP